MKYFSCSIEVGSLVHYRIRAPNGEEARKLAESLYDGTLIPDINMKEDGSEVMWSAADDEIEVSEITEVKFNE